MKRKRIIILSSIVLAVIAILGGLALFNALHDEMSLSISEKKWLDKNRTTVYSIAVPNDIPIFGDTGEGVFFDYIEFLKNRTKLSINNNTVSYLSSNSGYRFEVTPVYDNDALLLFKDHYVLVSRNTGLINNPDTIPSLGVAVINNGVDQVSSYFDVGADSFRAYDTFAAITEALGNGTVTYALVPLNEYKDELIANNMNVLCHISDLNKFYYLKLGDNTTLNSILTKEFNEFKEHEFDKSYNKNNYNLFIECLKITEVEEETLTNKVYNYGFTENRPFEILASSQYGGVTAQYLQSFSDFSGVEFTYKKYRTANDLVTAAVGNKMNLYYNYYNMISNYIDCGALNSIKYYVIADNSIDLSLSNITGLQYLDVYVLNNSYLYELIKDIEGINVITYDNTNDLKKIFSKPNIIVVDEYTFDYYINNNTNSYSVRYKGIYEDYNYTFKYENNTDAFYKLFNAYTKTINPDDLVRDGVTTYNKVDRSGKILGNIAKGILFLLVVCSGVALYIRKSVKKVKLNTKVKKEDRMKYIDLLTSLKNRNYYNEKLPVWNKNTIYPQTCIVMDINQVKVLNDTLGYEEGDKQIQAVANILIKTQLDNSEIIRTDGNEFLVYMIGYSEKQVLTYMKKLVKEFKKLPYDNGVAMGFSMIEDDTKLVDDAFNEASNQMRENKELDEDEEDE